MSNYGPDPFCKINNMDARLSARGEISVSESLEKYMNLQESTFQERTESSKSCHVVQNFPPFASGLYHNFCPAAETNYGTHIKFCLNLGEL